MIGQASGRTVTSLPTIRGQPVQTTDIMPENRAASTGDESMRAAVFQGAGEIRLEERPVPECGPNDAIVRVRLTTICGTDVHIWRGEYPVEPGRIVGHEPVGVIDRARRRGHRLRGRRPRPGRGDHALRHLLLLSGPQRVAVLGPRGRVGDDRRLAPRQLDRRGPGRVLPGPLRPGQPGKDPRRPDRRAVRAARRHRLDRDLSGGAGRRAHRRDGRRLRPGADRPLRHRGRAADGRLAGDRRRLRSRSAFTWRGRWGPTR